MKRFATVVAISASFLLGGAVSAVAQDEHREREEERKEERHGADEEQRHEAHGQRRAEERHEAHEERRAEERHEAHEERRAEERHEELRRISDEHFREHFGREHYFAVGRVTVLAGHPHFAYGGYRFEIGQPWPARWAYSDHCYIDFVEGRYFLSNVRHPGVRVAVTVVP